MRRPLYFFTLLFALVLGAGAGLLVWAGRGLVRVGPDHFAAAGVRILGPGWHLVSPLSRAEILAVEGDGALPPLAVTSREGVRATAVLSFHYRAEPDELARAAERTGRGFHPLLEAAASRGLRTVLESRSGSDFLDRTSLQAPLAASLTESFGTIGLRISNLRWDIRLPEEFRRNLLRSEYASRARATGNRVLLIGLDAADWESIDPLLAAGRLPNLKRLIQAGVRGPLHSYNPMVSPLLWTTAATGKGPDVHGVADFSILEAKTRKRIPITSRYRKVKSIWNILTDFNRSSAFVGWWASYPADRVEGYQVTDRVAALSLLPNRQELADRSGYTFPAGYLKELLPKLASPRQISYEEVRRFADVTPAQYEAGRQWVEHPPEPPKEKERKQKPPVPDPVGLLIKILTAAHNYQTAALDLLRRGPFDLTGVYFEGIDLVGHRFQHYRPPRMKMVSEAEYRQYRETVTEYYVFQDRLLGELLEAAGPGATVMIISDHGFKNGVRRPEGLLPYTTDQPVEWHRKEGIFILSGPGAGTGHLAEPATLFDITPTLLALLGVPVAADMPGRVLTDALDPRFREKYPVERVPTYEGVGAPRESEAADTSDEVSAEMMAQLRALGYVGGDVPAASSPEPEGKRSPSSESAAEDTPVSYHRNLATYYLARRRHAEAIDELKEANRRQKLPKSYAMLAEAYDELGRKEAAMAALEEGWREVPDSMAADSILWYVSLAVDTGAPERGRRFLTGHLDQLKEAPAIRDAAEGRLAEAEGRRAVAAARYEKALEIDPTIVLATRQLLAFYTQEGRTAAIRPILERGLRQSERIDEYHNLLGGLDSREGRKEEALAHFRRAADLNPADPRFDLNVGLTLMDLERWEEAEKAFEKAVAAHPTVDLYLGLGNVRLRLGDPTRAMEAFQRARETGGDPKRAELGIALSFLGLKRSNEALSFARESLARDPDNLAMRNLYQDLLSRGR